MYLPRMNLEAYLPPYKKITYRKGTDVEKAGPTPTCGG